MFADPPLKILVVKVVELVVDQRDLSLSLMLVYVRVLAVPVL